MTRFIAVLFFLTAVITFSFAAETISSKPVTYGPWRSSIIGGGGYIQNVVLCPTNPKRLYSYVDVAGVFRSDDGGLRWRMMHGSMPTGKGYEIRGLMVDPRDDKKLIIAAGSQWEGNNGIWTSDNAGETWKLVQKASFWGNGDYRWAGTILARDPLKPDVVYATAVEDGVFRSVDNGKSWVNIGQKGVFPSDLKIDRANPSRILLCAAPEKAWFNNAQREWQAGFYISSDKGKSWKKVSDLPVSEILQDPADPRIFYSIIDNRVQRSTDGGLSWMSFDLGLPPHTSKSGNTNEDEFQALAAGPDFVLTASTKGTFYRLDSGAQSWMKIERKGVVENYEGKEWFRHKGGGMGSALGSIVVDPRNPKHWFFTDWYAIYQTSDAGTNWNLTINGMEVTVCHCVEQDPVDPNKVYLGMADDGYFYSIDGGERFTNVDWTKGISNNIKCISVSRSNTKRLYAVGPVTWEWVANQVFISNDGGLQWARSQMKGLPDMAAHHCNTIVADPVKQDRVYLSMSGEIGPGKGGVYVSGDAGNNWQWMGEGLPEGQPYFTHEIWSVGREIAMSSDGTMICTGKLTGKVYRSDGGKWLPCAGMGGSVNCVVADPFKPGRFFAAADGIYATEDAGKTWRCVRSGEGAGFIAFDGAKAGRIAAGMSDGVLLSTDGGATWVKLDKRLPYRRIPEVAFCGDRLVIGTGGNGAFWMDLP